MRPRAILSSGLGGSLVASGTGVFETVDEGGNPDVMAHGAMGATETIDAADGNQHTGTLDDDCTITVAAFAAGSIIFAVTQDGTGGHGITWSGVTFAGDDQPEQAAGDVTVYALLSSGGTVYGFKAGGGGGASALDDLTDVTITSPTEDDDLRYNGSFWVNDARKWEAVTNGEDVFVWESDDLVHEWST